MTVQELSNQFDALISSYKRFKDFDAKEELDSFEFNEYEKSIFLTNAQEELILSLYNGRNPSLQSFEETEELRRYLSNLIEEVELSPIETVSGKPLGMESNSKFFTLPENLWFITYEKALCSNETCKMKASQDVYPVRQYEYNRVKKNPFRGANERRALRLDLSEGNVEIISKFGVTSYYVRYIRKVKPIILEDLPNNLEIRGVSTISECELHEALHQIILKLAVQMALQSKGIKVNNENK